MNKLFLLLALSFLTVSCGMKDTPKMTPMEIQSIQTRDFESTKAIVFPSVVSVFQDIGYNIESADIASGLIVAESLKDSNYATMFLFGVTDIRSTKANAFIEEIGNMTKVRLNFINVREQSNIYGQEDRNDNQILEVEPYKNAFEKIENAIFVRSGS